MRFLLETCSPRHLDPDKGTGRGEEIQCGVADRDDSNNRKILRLLDAQHEPTIITAAARSFSFNFASVKGKRKSFPGLAGSDEPARGCRVRAYFFPKLCHCDCRHPASRRQSDLASLPGALGAFLLAIAPAMRLRERRSSCE